MQDIEHLHGVVGDAIDNALAKAPRDVEAQVEIGDGATHPRLKRDQIAGTAYLVQNASGGGGVPGSNIGVNCFQPVEHARREANPHA